MRRYLSDLIHDLKHSRQDRNFLLFMTVVYTALGVWLVFFDGWRVMLDYFKLILWWANETWGGE